jgi:HK97 family phage portal protein
VSLLKRFLSPRSATPDNPRFSLNDPVAWDAFADGAPSASGVTVNRETALTYSPWWRGINLLSRDVAKVPLLVYGVQGKTRARDQKHPSYFLLRRKANIYQTAQAFKQQITGHAVGGGNGYAYISRRGDSSPAELLPLDPDHTYPVRENGKLWYVHEIAGESRKLPAEDVLHLKGYGFDGLQGYNVIRKARDSLGLGMGAARFQTIYFRNSARPAVVLETTSKLDDKQQTTLRESWERMHAGLENAHRTAILQNGLTAKILSFSAEDSQLIETRTFSIREVANWIGVPPHKLGDNSQSAYATLEQENQSYLDESLDPWFCAWEEECWDKLLTEEEKAKETHEIEFLRRALERADSAARAAYLRAALGGRPWVTQNEARAECGLDPSPDPKADEILEPLNMGQGGSNNDEKPPAPPPKRPPVKKQED